MQSCYVVQQGFYEEFVNDIEFFNSQYQICMNLQGKLFTSKYSYKWVLY